MRVHENRARVRCLERQNSALRDELRRESKRSAWALQRLKEKEQSVRSLEDRATELACVNTRLMHERTAAQDAQKAMEELREAEIAKLREASRLSEQQVADLKETATAKLEGIAAEMFRLENAIGKRTQNLQRRHFLHRVEKEIGHVAQRVLLVKDGFEKCERSDVPANVGKKVCEQVTKRIESEESDNGNVRKILTTYRTAMSKLREQVE